MGPVTSKTLQPLDHTLGPPKNNHPATSQAYSATGLLDSAATGHYGNQHAKQHCTDVILTDTGPSVQVANGQIIKPNKRVTFSLATDLSKSPFHKVQCQDIQEWTNHHCWKTQPNQRAVEHPPGPKRADPSNNAQKSSQDILPRSKRCHSKWQDKTRPISFPPRKRLQPGTVYFSMGNRTRSFPLMARPNHRPC